MPAGPAGKGARQRLMLRIVGAVIKSRRHRPANVLHVAGRMDHHRHVQPVKLGPVKAAATDMSAQHRGTAVLGRG